MDKNLIDCLPFGVVATDPKGFIKTMNGYARKFLGMGLVEGKPIKSFIADLDLPPLGRFLSTVKKSDKIIEVEVSSVEGSGGTADFVILLKDVTDAEKNRELAWRKNSYALLQEFSANIAHEMRNPLGGIELYASVLKKELKRKKDIERVNQIIAAVRIVESKIANLIRLSKNFDIPLEPVNIHLILKDILLSSEEIIDGETVFLSAKYADVEPFVNCSPEMIKQIFLNLILNALQAMPPKGRLDISTNYDSARHFIDICLLDRSPHDADCAVSQIFDRFSHTSEKSSHLGLAMVHNIVNMYGGSLKIESVEKAGTAFILSFPVLKTAGSSGERLK